MSSSRSAALSGRIASPLRTQYRSRYWYAGLRNASAVHRSTSCGRSLAMPAGSCGRAVRGTERVKVGKMTSGVGRVQPGVSHVGGPRFPCTWATETSLRGCG